MATSCTRVSFIPHVINHHHHQYKIPAKDTATTWTLQLLIHLLPKHRHLVGTTMPLYTPATQAQPPWTDLWSGLVCTTTRKYTVNDIPAATTTTYSLRSHCQLYRNAIASVCTPWPRPQTVGCHISSADIVSVKKNKKSTPTYSYEQQQQQQQHIQFTVVSEDL